MGHVPAERCVAIIELLAHEAASLPLGEIAERLGLPKSGAHRVLATLVDTGWVEQHSDTGFYRLTMRLATLGQQFYVATGIPDVCQPMLDRLAKQGREFVRLAVVDGDGLGGVAHAQGASGGLLYQPSLVSNTVPIHATATGKAWLAAMPEEEALQKVIKQDGFDGAARYGPNAVRSVAALLREVRATARRGYGLAVNEAEPGVTAIAAAIHPCGTPRAVGTVSIAGPSVRMAEQRVRELAPLVVQTARDIAALWPLRSGGPAGASRGTAARAA